MAQQSYLIQPGESAADQYKRKLAYSMLEAGSSGAPIGHWSQGLNRLAQSMLGGYQLYKMDQRDAEDREGAQKILAETLGLGGASPAPGASVRSPSGGSMSNLPAPSVQPAQASAAAAGRDYAPTPAGNMNPVNLIKGFEGYTATAQPDYKQTSIGYGTKALPGETSITPQVAETRLNAETQKVADFVDQQLPGLDPERRSALISFGYNLGIGKGGLSDLIPAAKAGNWQQVASAMQRYNHAGGEVNAGLTSRRGQEASMIQGGPGPAAPAQAAGTPGVAPQQASASPLGINAETAATIQKLSMNRYTAPLAQKLLEAALTPQNKIGRYRPTKQGIVDTVTGQVLPGTASQVDAEFGTSTKAFEDVDGNLQYMQFSKAGGGETVKLPAGARWRPDVEIKDTGTEFVPISKQTGQVAGPATPKNVTAEAQQKKFGTERGELEAKKPQATLAANTSIYGLDALSKEIANLKAMPGLASATGNLQSRLPNVFQSTADADSSIRNIKGKVATTALQAMRDASKTGGAVGGVTEKEWPIIESMIANLDPSQGDALFIERLNQLDQYIQGAKGRINAAYADTYGEAVPPTTAGAPPPSGTPNPNDPLGILGN